MPDSFLFISKPSFTYYIITGLGCDEEKDSCICLQHWAWAIVIKWGIGRLAYLFHLFFWASNEFPIYRQSLMCHFHYSSSCWRVEIFYILFFLFYPPQKRRIIEVTHALCLTLIPDFVMILKSGISETGGRSWTEETWQLGPVTESIW